LWDAKSGKRLWQFRQLTHVGAVAFLAGGSTIVTTSEDGTVQVRHTADGKPAGPALKVPGEIVGLTAAPDGKTLWIATPKQILSWDPAKREPRELFSGNFSSGELTWVRISPDGKNLVSGSPWNTQGGRLWNLSARRLVRTLVHYGDAITAAAFSPDGRIILTASGKGARCWDGATGRSLGPLWGDGSAVWTGAFRSDGQVFVMGKLGAVRFGAVPTPMAGTIAQIKQEIEWMTGMELEEQGTFRKLDAESLSQRRRQLE
jgi:WD40 repeat protein